VDIKTLHQQTGQVEHAAVNDQDKQPKRQDRDREGEDEQDRPEHCIDHAQHRGRDKGGEKAVHLDAPNHAADQEQRQCVDDPPNQKPLHQPSL